MKHLVRWADGAWRRYDSPDATPGSWRRAPDPYPTAVIAMASAGTVRWHPVPGRPGDFQSWPEAA